MSVDSVHQKVGGTVLAVGAIQFVISMILVQLNYPGYDDSRNPVSDLGNSTLSSLAWLYNGSIIIAGITGILTTFFMIRFFQKRQSPLSSRQLSIRTTNVGDSG